MAESLGYASVNRMLEEMSSEEFSEWMAFFNLRGKRLEKQKNQREEDAKKRAKESNH